MTLALNPRQLLREVDHKHPRSVSSCAPPVTRCSRWLIALTAAHGVTGRRPFATLARDVSSRRLLSDKLTQPVLPVIINRHLSLAAFGRHTYCEWVCGGAWRDGVRRSTERVRLLAHGSRLVVRVSCQSVHVIYSLSLKAAITRGRNHRKTPSPCND